MSEIWFAEDKPIDESNLDKGCVDPDEVDENDKEHGILKKADSLLSIGSEASSLGGGSSIHSSSSSNNGNNQAVDQLDRERQLDSVQEELLQQGEAAQLLQVHYYLPISI